MNEFHRVNFYHTDDLLPEEELPGNLEAVKTCEGIRDIHILILGLSISRLAAFR